MAEITVQQAIDVLYKQFPIEMKWGDIKEKPALVTSDDLKTVTHLQSPDGSTWSPSIDNSGTVTWNKLQKEENNDSKTSN